MKKLPGIMLLCLPLGAMAATMIESRDGQGQRSQIYIDGQRAHMQMAENMGHMVLDVKNNTMKAVVHEQRTVMDMSDLLQGKPGAAGQPVNSDVRPKGAGPKIAGYATRQYDVYASGKYCGSSYGSVDAMNELGLQKFARAMQTMSSQMRNTLSSITGGSNPLASPCQQAQIQLSERAGDIGFPLRVIDASKHLVSEVTAIDKNAKLPANAFSIPSDYKVMNPNKMMQDAMKQMPDMMKNMPPEAMEMMRQRMQDMQKMYQQ